MPNVKVLLKDNIEKLGRIGQVVSVKPGYARNFLIPQGLATIPSIGEVRQIKKKKELLEKQYQEEKVQAEETLKVLLENMPYEITAKAGEAGKLFGSITGKDIVEKINEKLSNVQLDKKQVNLKRAITHIGEYSVKIKLHTEVSSEIKIVIKAEEKDA